MTGFAFIRQQVYARKGSHGKSSIRSIIAEAAREPDACPHVEAPAVPTLLRGVPLNELEQRIEEEAAQAVSANGKRLMSTRAVLIAGVASFPHTVEECRENPDVMKLYKTWERLNLEFLEREHGANLKSVVRHLDETHPHIHFYVTPTLEADGQYNIDLQHRGRKAQSEVEKEGGNRKQSRDAYKAGMRSYLDDYYDQVAVNIGMARVGPGARRLTRKEWVQEQQQAAALAEAGERARELLRDAQMQASALHKKAQKQGFETGKAAGLAASQSAGEKLGTVFKAIKNTVSNDAQQQADAVRVKAKAALAKKSKEIEDERARAQAADNAARDLAAANVRLQASLEREQARGDVLEKMLNPSPRIAPAAPAVKPEIIKRENVFEFKKGDLEL